jgi:hypothetical protein
MTSMENISYQGRKLRVELAEPKPENDFDKFKKKKRKRY